MEKLFAVDAKVLASLRFVSPGDSRLRRDGARFSREHVRVRSLRGDRTIANHPLVTRSSSSSAFHPHVFPWTKAHALSAAALQRRDTMPVSTRNMRARWPPIDGSAGGDLAMTLPPELYWNYVRPFTPFVDRAIINKRTGTTRFYAGDRVTTDEDYLEEKYGSYGGYRYIPAVHGKPGSPQFRVYIRTAEVDDREQALDMLIKVRKDWDAHLSTIESPSERLQVCLNLLCNLSEEGEEGFGFPLLFCGEGKVEDVVAFHASMNLWSINGPPTSYVFPNTQLGYWIDRYLASVIEGIMVDFVAEGPGEETMREIIVALLDEGADATHFFEPLQSVPPVHSTAIHSNDGTGFQGAFYLQHFMPGTSGIQCMQNFSESFEDPYDGEYGIEGLDWVVEQLETGPIMSRFFEMSEKVGLVMESERFGLPATSGEHPVTRIDLTAYKMELGEEELVDMIVRVWNFVQDPRSKGDINENQVFYHPDFDPDNLPNRPLRMLDEDEKEAILARFNAPHSQVG